MKLKLKAIDNMILHTANKVVEEDIELVVDDTNIKPENIKKDVSILGINGTYEGSSSGGGLDINGIIEEYQVYAGENINAGDFVEFITNTYKALNSTSQSCYYPPSCILLESNKVFIAHSYSNNRYLYGTIIQISGTTMTATTTQLNSDQYSCYNAPSCILLENNKVFIAHSYSTSSYLYGTIVQISGTTMTAKSAQLNSTSKNCYNAPSCTLLENNKVFIAHSHSNNRYLYGTIVQISGTTMTATTTQLNSAACSCYHAPSCTLLENNKVFIAHSYNSSGYYLYGTIVQISGTTMTTTTTKLNSTSRSCYNAPSCTLLENNKVFIAHSYNNNRYLYGTIVQINGTTMTPRTTQLNNTSKSSYDAPSCILLENNKVFIAHSYTDSQYLYGAIFFNNPYVSPYNSTINGIAKTSGASGETIEIYIPN